MHVSGTTATDGADTIIGIGDSGAQTAFIIEKIERALRAAGAELTDVVRTRLYLAPGADWEAVSRVHGQYFGEIRPANTLVYVHALVGAGLPGRDGSRSDHRRSLAMKFSLRFNNDLPVRDYLKYAAAAEAAGFDQFWVSNDLFLRSAPVILSALAMTTERIEIGSCILNPYTMHPAEIAMFAATLDELSGGRFNLGAIVRCRRLHRRLARHGLPIPADADNRGSRGDQQAHIQSKCRDARARPALVGGSLAAI